MARLVYYFFLYPLSLLPLKLLYKISDFFYLVIYYLVGYRKKVVLSNLQHAFPEKSPAEIRSISKKFYRHFCDIIFESIKSFSISARELQSRMCCLNPPVFKPFHESGKSLVLVTGHYGNWEWGGMDLFRHSGHKGYGIYLPVENKFLDRKLRESRGRFGTSLISTRELARGMFGSKNEVSMYAFIIDQNPSNLNKSFWMNFLNRDIPAAKGAEKYAVQFNYPVLYGHIKQLSRGHYGVEYELVEMNPVNTQPGEITERCMRILESEIKAKPEQWLWTHKRWKHKKPASIVSAHTKEFSQI